MIEFWGTLGTPSAARPKFKFWYFGTMNGPSVGCGGIAIGTLRSNTPRASGSANVIARLTFDYPDYPHSTRLRHYPYVRFRCRPVLFVLGCVLFVFGCVCFLFCFLHLPSVWGTRGKIINGINSLTTNATKSWYKFSNPTFFCLYLF